MEISPRGFIVLLSFTERGIRVPLRVLQGSYKKDPITVPWRAPIKDAKTTKSIRGRSCYD